MSVETMRSVVVGQYGTNEEVHIAQVARPEPKAGEILIKVCAAGVNPIDWKIRSGAGQRLGMTLPIHLGGELVGMVENLGAGVDQFAAGDTVFGMVPSGAFADYAVSKAADMVRVPPSLSLVQAAALPLAGTTAWQAMFGETQLIAGQRILITNSSGGVGSLAVQFAKATGAHVTAVASGRNEAFVRSLGADVFIDYTQEAFENIACDMHMVLDTVGGDTFARALRTLRPGGSMVTVVAFPDGEAERLGVRARRSFTVPSAANLSAIAALVERGKVTPHIDEVFPLENIRVALATSEGGRVRGKVVLAVAPLSS